MGLEAGMQVHDRVNVRAGANFLNTNFDYQTGSGSDFDVDAGIRLSNFFAAADWYPFDFDLRFIGGVFYNNNEINTTMLPKKTYTVGGDVYSPEELGTLTADLTFNPVAPYLAMGYGNPFSGSSFGFNIEAGFFIQGSPKVSMVGEGLIEPSAEQGPILEDNLSWFTLYPVLTMSLYYRIN